MHVSIPVVKWFPSYPKQLTPVVTWLDGHGRLDGEQQQRGNQRTERCGTLRFAVFSIFGEARGRLADSEYPKVDPGVTKLCVSGRKPNQRLGWKGCRSQRREEGL